MDLFGEHVLRCTNAGIGKRNYAERTIAVGDVHVRAALGEIIKRRRAHAYTVVSASTCQASARSTSRGES